MVQIACQGIVDGLQRSEGEGIVFGGVGAEQRD